MRLWVAAPTVADYAQTTTVRNQYLVHQDASKMDATVAVIMSMTATLRNVCYLETAVSINTSKICNV